MQSKSSKSRVHVLNPAGGCGHIPLSQARRFVREGRAEWDNGKLRFLEGHHAHLSVLAELNRYEVTHHGEGAGMATLAAVEGLPVAGSAIRLFTGRRADKPPVDHSTVLLRVRPVPLELQPSV